MNVEKVTTKADLANVNPIDYEIIEVEEEGCNYVFKYGSTSIPDGENTIAVGSYPEDHPDMYYAGKPFMVGCWHKQ